MVDKIEQTSPLTSSLKITIFGMIVLFLTIGGFFGWAVWAPLAIGVVSNGTVVVDSKRKIIQHLEGGIIQSINVKEGSHVSGGAVLLTLDDTQAKSNRDTTKIRYLQEVALLNRLEAEIDGNEIIKFDVQLTDFLHPAVQESLSIQKNLLKANLNHHKGQIDLLKQKIELLQKEIKGLKVQKKARWDEENLIRIELNRIEGLSKRKLVEINEVFQSKKELARVQGEIGRIETSIVSAQTKIGEAEIEILQIDKKAKQEITEQIRTTHGSVSELRNKLIKDEDVLSRTEIRAPQSGTVIGLSAHTIGGVIAPGDKILEIVPDNDRLIIESQIKPTDIDNIARGMTARVRFSAFKQRTTPSLNGVVEQISADALFNSNLNTSYYQAQLVVPTDEMKKIDGFPVVPGMPVEVFIEGGVRTAMEYLLDPLLEVVRRGMKEE